MADLGGVSFILIEIPFQITTCFNLLVDSSVPAWYRTDIAMAFRRGDRYGLQEPIFRFLRTFSGLDPIAWAQLIIAAAHGTAYFEEVVFGIIAFVGGEDMYLGMWVILSIDSAKMKRKQTSLTPFLDKKVCQSKAIYVY